MPAEKYDIRVEATAQYVPADSEPDAGRFVFAYRIRIANHGSLPARLVSRHWFITDERGEVEEVEGEGVVGEQPQIEPGETYEYSSGCALPTSFGAMRGIYQMVATDGTEFEANIPEFYLVGPRVLH